MRRILLLPFLLPLLSMTSAARLGDTYDQCEARYGLPKPHLHDRSYVLLEGAKEYTFLFHGWLIRLALVPARDGKEYVVRERYLKRADEPVSQVEKEAILEAESAGMKWTESASAVPSTPEAAAAQALPKTLNSGYTREDGATASLSLSGIELQLPQASTFEAQFREIRERQARERVPKF